MRVNVQLFYINQNGLVHIMQSLQYDARLDE